MAATGDRYQRAGPRPTGVAGAAAKGQGSAGERSLHVAFLTALKTGNSLRTHLFSHTKRTRRALTKPAGSGERQNSNSQPQRSPLDPLST